MAFTPQEKMYLLFYLGFSGFEDDGPAVRSINSLDSKESTMGPIIREHLDLLRTVDREIKESLPLASAIEDGSVKLRHHYTLASLRSVGKQYVQRLSTFTKIPMGGDVFAVGGTNSTQFSGDPSEHRFDNRFGVPTYET